MGLNRRTFIKFLAGAGAGVSITPIPWKLLDDVSIWSQNWSWIPSNIKGENSFVSTISKYCPSNLAYKVRLVGGRPVRTLPDSDHPLGGGLTALAAAEVQMLYSTARVKQPLKRSPDGKLLATSWEDAFNTLVAGLKTAKGSLTSISGDENGTINEFISAFVAAAGSQDAFIMPSEAQAAAKAWALMGGQGIAGYDIENSDYVLAIGSSVLESWGTVARNRRAFSARSEHGAAPSVRYVFAGPVQNNTAAGADLWLPIKPGTELILALGLANLLIAAGKSFDSSDFHNFKTLASAYTPEKVQELTGTPADKLKAVAAELAKAKKPLVLCGSSFGQGSGAAPFMAGFALNLMLKGLNAEGGLKALASKGAVIEGAKSVQELLQKDLVAYMEAGKMPKAMLFYEANPAYALPNTAKIKELLNKVPFKVSFSTFLDETSEMCDLVLPIPMGLERADDAYTPFGSGQIVYSLAMPVVKTPLADAKAADEILAKAAHSLGYTLTTKSLADAIKAKVAQLGADPKKLAKGQAFVSKETLSLELNLRPEILAGAAKTQSAEKLVLAPQFKLNMGIAKTGIPPFNTKTIKANELLGHDMFVTLNKNTAAENGLNKNDMVEISSSADAKNSIKARIHIYEGMVNNAVGIILGFGHSALDEFSQNKGYNAMNIISTTAEPSTGLSAWAQTGVKIAKVRG